MTHIHNGFPIVDVATTPAADPPAPPKTGGYVSQYGQDEGLEQRIHEWRDRLANDKTVPWVGMGLIADLDAVLRALTAKPKEARLFAMQPVAAAARGMQAQSATDLLS